MGERLTGYHPKGEQAKQPLNSAIAGFCDQYTSANTREAYERDLQDFSRFATGADVSQLGQLTPEHIDGYFKHCQKNGLSKSTIRRRTASLSSFLRRSGMEGFAKTAREISIEHIGSKPEMQPFHPLSNDEIKRLQEVSQDNARASAIIAIALGTGAALEEIRGLNVSDILEKESLRVAVRFRGRRSKREITLDDDSSEIVRRYKGDREGENPLFAKKPQIRPGEDRLSQPSIWGDVKQYAKEIGRPDLNPRVLRETFIANAQTNDLKELAELLGVGGRYARALLKRSSLTQQLPENGVLFEAQPQNNSLK